MAISNIKPSVAESMEQIKNSQSIIWEIVKKDWPSSLSSLKKLLGILGHHHRDIHERAFSLAVEQVGIAPGVQSVRYVPLLLGSGARGEQLLFSDQDHALIFELDEDMPLRLWDWDAYFSQIGHVYAALLHELGYPLCAGNVMMSNARWRGEIGKWKSSIQEYMDYPDWENIRFLLIASEARPIVGDLDLFSPIRQSIMNHIANSPYICWKIADQGIAERIPGMKSPHRRQPFRDVELAVKERLYTPLVNAVRLWALHEQIDAVSTFDRIESLQKIGVWSEPFAADVTTSLRVALTMRLREQWKKNKAKYAVVEVDPPPLSREDWEAFNSSLITLRKLVQLSTKYFPRPRR